MPETAVKTRDDIALAAVKQLFTQEVYQPDLLRVYITALKQAVGRFNRTGEKIPDAFITGKGLINQNDIVATLTRFNQTLGENLSIDKLNLFDPIHLDRLDKIIVQVSGLPAEASAEAGFAPEPPPANIPPDLKALVAEFDKAHQAAVSAQAKRQGWSPERFREELAKQNAITVQMHQVRQYTLSQLEWTITNSAALENLAAALGRRPEAVKRLAKIHLQTLVDKHITAQTFRQARALITDPVQLAAYYTAQLKKDILSNDLLSLAAADRHPQTKKNNVDTALKNIKIEAAAETEKVKPAIKAAAKNLAEHPTVRKTAQTDAVAAVKQVKPDIPPAKAARLNQQLVRHQDNPSVQEKIIANAFEVSAAQSKIIRSQLAPQINQLAASTQRFNPLLAADTTGILADALRNPNRFPKPFVDAIKSGKISDDQIATIIQTANLLGVPVSAVTFSYYGVDSSQVKTNLTRGRAALPPDHPSVVTLSHLATAQTEINKARQQNLLPPSLEKDMESSIRHYTRAIRWNKFTESINPFRLFTGIGTRLNEIPQFSGTLSGFRVESGPIDSVFNFIGSLGNTTRSLPGFITRPFAAVGSAISNTIINPVKTWANTQIKSGLARAGAWLAKKGVTEAAKKVGGALLGKAAAGLLGAAVGGPVGWVAGALTLLSTLGDIGKFIWANRKEIGFGLAGGFLLGQLLLGKLLGFLSSMGTVGLTTGIGALIGTFIFPGIGTAIGAGLGFGAGLMINAAGGLGAALSGLGTALGSAAAGLSSFIGALTAPSLVASIPATAALIVPAVITGAIIYQNFFFNPILFGALFVAPDSGAFPPGGIIPPDSIISGSCPLVENPFISTGSLGSGYGSKEHGGKGYGPNHCYGIPIEGMWVWEDNTTPKPGCLADSASACNVAACPYYGFATDVSSSSTDNPTIRVPIICSATEASTGCGPMTWTVVKHFYNCRGGSTDTKEECKAKEFLGADGKILPKNEQLWGWGTILESHDNGHYWRLYLNHYETTTSMSVGRTFSATPAQSDTVGIIPANAYVQHLHYELLQDGIPVRPDYLCL